MTDWLIWWLWWDQWKLQKEASCQSPKPPPSPTPAPPIALEVHKSTYFEALILCILYRRFVHAQTRLKPSKTSSLKHRERKRGVVPGEWRVESGEWQFLVESWDMKGRSAAGSMPWYWMSRASRGWAAAVLFHRYSSAINPPIPYFFSFVFGSVKRAGSEPVRCERRENSVYFSRDSILLYTHCLATLPPLHGPWLHPWLASSTSYIIIPSILSYSLQPIALIT